MKAFLTSLVVLLAISTLAAIALNRVPASSRDTFIERDVRL